MIRWPWRRTAPSIALERTPHRLAYTKPTMYRHCAGCLRPLCVIYAAQSERHADQAARVLRVHHDRLLTRNQG